MRVLFTHDREEKHRYEIVNLFNERNGETALVRNDQSSNETAKDSVDP